MSKRPRPNLTTYMEALGQEFDVEPSSIKKVGFQSGVDSVDVTITVDRSVDPFGSLVAAWVSSPKPSTSTRSPSPSASVVRTGSTC